LHNKLSSPIANSHYAETVLRTSLTN